MRSKQPPTTKMIYLYKKRVCWTTAKRWEIHLPQLTDGMMKRDAQKSKGKVPDLVIYYTLQDMNIILLCSVLLWLSMLFRYPYQSMLYQWCNW